MGGRGPGGPRPNADPSELVATIMAFDKNGDGKLGVNELPARMEALIDRADMNKDGFVSPAELTEYARRQSSRGQGLGPQGGPGFRPDGPPCREESGKPSLQQSRNSPRSPSEFQTFTLNSRNWTCDLPPWA